MGDIDQRRRYEDARMDKLETTVDKMQGDITYIKTKIDNGFSHSIENTEKRVDKIDERNEKDHEKLSSKLDKIMFMWVSGAISIIGGIILLIIKGMI